MKVTLSPHFHMTAVSLPHFYIGAILSPHDSNIVTLLTYDSKIVTRFSHGSNTYHVTATFVTTLPHSHHTFRLQQHTHHTSTWWQHCHHTFTEGNSWVLLLPAIFSPSLKDWHLLPVLGNWSLHPAPHFQRLALWWLVFTYLIRIGQQQNYVQFYMIFVKYSC